MMNVNNLNLFNFLLLSVLVPSVRSDYANNTKEQKKIAMEPQKNNLGEPSKTVITVMPEDNTKFSTHTENNFIYKENVTRIKSNSKKKNIPRQIRRTENEKHIKCLSCEAQATSKKDEKCYSGESSSLANCASGAECFTELHPQYIKRGCIYRSRLNRTFICKCPLCNDKPFDDTASYEYKTIRDWEYDNRRLRTTDKGIDLLCKVCDTKGINFAADKNCKHGKHTEYMVCGKNQLCYINIDLGTDFVSRGCVDMPVFNSLYYFCDQSMCNKDFFNPPGKSKQKKEISLIDDDVEDIMPKKVLVSRAYQIKSTGKETNFYKYIMLCIHVTVFKLVN